MRQIVLDTETTGLEVSQGHRIIEIGCVELMHRRATGRSFHRYLNPERDIDDGALAVHGLSRARLAQEPRFEDIADELLAFIAGSELIIHNAPFDLGFLDMEFSRLASRRGESGAPPAALRAACTVLDTLTLARERHPGQRNSLDALCKRYGIDNSHRELHGALLDARILADVYLAMTGGQCALALGEGARERAAAAATDLAASGARPTGPLRVVEPNPQELAAHVELTTLLQTASAGKCIWIALARASEARSASAVDGGQSESGPAPS